MPKKNSGDVAKRLEALVVELESAAYERGRADARKALLDALAPERARPPRPSGEKGKRAGKKAAVGRSAGGRKRAPKGTVPAFVERVLGAHPGLSPREILARAVSDAERSVPLTSIRTHLHIGRTRGRYAAIEGRWSLVVSDTGETTGDHGADTDESPPSVPDRDETGGTLGLRL